MRAIRFRFSLSDQLSRQRKRVGTPLDSLGFVLVFIGRSLGSIPKTLKRHRDETMRLITDMTWGGGSIIVGGGTVPLLTVLGITIGLLVGVQSYAILDTLGLGSVSGVVAAFANTRELAPITAGVGFAAQAGCRMTAQIGSMRISEEIDAIETLGLPAVRFVVTTRVIAGAVAVVPTYLLTLITSYIACRAVILLQGEAGGVYDHYFSQLISGRDVLISVLKVLVFAVAIILIHCYQGFFAAGGPEGVGLASGRAVRASFVAIILLDMVMTIAFWGFSSDVEFPG